MRGYKQIQKSGRPLRECVSGFRLDVRNTHVTRNTANILKNKYVLDSWHDCGKTEVMVC